MHNPKVAVVGLGGHGATVLARLVATGLATTVRECRPDGHAAAGSGASDSVPADVVVLNAQDPLDDLFDEGVASQLLRFGGCVLDLSPVTGAQAGARSTRLAGSGIFRVEVEVVGTALGTDDLLLAVAGPEVDVDVAAPVLRALGSFRHVGPIGFLRRAVQAVPAGAGELPPAAMPAQSRRVLADTLQDRPAA